MDSTTSEGTSLSTQLPVCNHRVYEVLLCLQASVILGFLAGILLATLGKQVPTAVGAGAGAFATCFGLSLTAVAYIKKQDN